MNLVNLLFFPLFFFLIGSVSTTAWLGVSVAIVLALFIAMAVGASRRRYIFNRMIEALEAMERGMPVRKLHLLVGGELGRMGRLIDSLSAVGASERDYLRLKI